MVQELLSRITGQSKNRLHVTSKRAVNRAVKASMQDQRDLLKKAKQIKARTK